MRSKSPPKATPPTSWLPLTPSALSSPAAIDSNPGAVGAKIWNRGEGEEVFDIGAQLSMSARLLVGGGILCACTSQSVETSNKRVGSPAAPRSLWPSGFQAWSVGAARCRSLRQGRAGGDADRKREITDLPAARSAAARSHDRRQSAHRPHEGPARQALRAGRELRRDAFAP